MHRYARRFPLGRAHDLLWRGLLEWLTGRTRRAANTWRSAIDVGDALGLPYERARAHLELGRRAASDAERPLHLQTARRLFDDLGCAEASIAGEAETPRPRHSEGHE